MAKIKRGGADMKWKQQEPSQTKNFAKFDIWERVEREIEKFIAQNQNTTFYENAKQNGWLGDRIKKGKRGLLGYLRTGFAIQIRILEELDDVLPIYQNHLDIVNFFRSDWFKNTTLDNGYVKPIYKKEHFEILKKEM